MDTFEHIVLSSVSFACAGILSFFIFHKDFSESVFIKTGIVMMALSMFSIGALTIDGIVSIIGMWRSTIMMHSGILIVLIGQICRMRSSNFQKLI